MRSVEVLCLANSRKYGGRCVAGIAAGIGWLRPVSSLQNGTLREQHYTCDNGHETVPLDVVQMDLVDQRPEPHQPENWIIANSRWRLKTKLQGESALSVLNHMLYRNANLLGGTSDKAHYEWILGHHATASLALVEPEGLRISIRTSIAGRKQVRAIFMYAHRFYDLPITDQMFEISVGQFSPGEYSRSKIPSLRNHRIFMTVSLGEPFGGYCYKLVAAVLALPQ
jgi:Dual OB-containing domain